MPESCTSQGPSSHARPAAVRVTLDHTATLWPLFLLFRAVETRGIEPLTAALRKRGVTPTGLSAACWPAPSAGSVGWSARVSLVPDVLRPRRVVPHPPRRRCAG